VLSELAGGDVLRCFPDAKLDTNQLSLSWWLAAAMQAEIDVQRCDKNNRQTLADILRLSPQDGATP
jgi:hypothetical protein